MNIHVVQDHEAEEVTEEEVVVMVVVVVDTDLSIEETDRMLNNNNSC